MMKSLYLPTVIVGFFMVSSACALAANINSATGVNSSEHVYFCVGTGEKCMKVRKQSINKYPSSKLAKLVSGELSADKAYMPKSTYKDNSIDVAKRELIVLPLVDSKSFKAIVRWLEQDSMSLVNPDIRQTVQEDAHELGLNELASLLQPVCPPGFVEVPGHKDYHTPKAGQNFCVMKYAAGKDGEKAVSRMNIKPWVYISFDEAKDKCRELGPGYHIITSDEWLAMARDLESNSKNWNGGVGPVGTGSLAVGNIVQETVSPGRDDNDGYDGFFLRHIKWPHRRTFYLTNGNVLWDVVGNALQWVKDDKSKDFVTDAKDWYDYTLPALPESYRPLGPCAPSTNVGKFYSNRTTSTCPSSHASIRGGFYVPNEQGQGIDGIYKVIFNANKAATGMHIGFRCAYYLYR